MAVNMKPAIKKKEKNAQRINGLDFELLGLLPATLGSTASGLTALELLESGNELCSKPTCCWLLLGE
jgi:hypothetical protein